MATEFIRNNASSALFDTVVAHRLSTDVRVPYMVTLITVILVFAASVAKIFRPSPFPLINGRKPFELTSIRQKKEFMAGAWDIVLKGLKHAAGKPFRVVADVGEVIILPPKYAYEIRNRQDMPSALATFKWYYAHLPGFEGFREGSSESEIIKLVSNKQLTHQLTIVTKPISDECAAALQDVYTNDKDWHEIVIKEANLKIMARITSRVFLGEELSRDPDWFRITTAYAVETFRAVHELRLFPAWLRSTVQWFLPHCTAARKLVQEARDVIKPLLEKRRTERIERATRGEKAEWDDAIDWLEQLSQENGLTYDAVVAQLSLSVAALHSTTDFFTQVTLDIGNHPEIIEPLRKEIISVLGQGGWTKHSLYNLKLMDSVMKESQRLKPLWTAAMRRYTTANITLSDGIVIPKDNFTFVAANRHWDASVYENPDIFDPYRFLRMRQQPGKENTSQFVTVTPEHMGFGYGMRACPGRFFASEEIKIALCHMLMKYDFEPVPGSYREPIRVGLNMTANPTAKLAVRRRSEEIAINAI